MKRVLSVALLLGALPAWADITMLSGKHNFSVTGTGQFKAQSERRICVFCHVPHRGGKNGDNRPKASDTRGAYQSTTANASKSFSGPTGSSRVCLSCHDGTIAVGQTLAAGSIAMRGSADGRIDPGTKSHLADLSMSHPVSFRPGTSNKHHAPLPGDRVKLDRGGQVQCTSCHDPHSEENAPGEKQFLVKSSRTSALCQSCHEMPGWRTNPAAHQASLASLNGASGPLAQSAWSNVSEAACGACHKSHDAGASRLVRSERAANEDRACLGCHNGRVAKVDLFSEVSKPYSHSTLNSGPSGHDAAEGPLQPGRSLPEMYASASRHVSCVDCHNPHAAYARPSLAPRVPGALAGVWGIDRYGQRIDTVNYEYEICFKCHADSANQPQARGPALPETFRRAVTEVNLRRVFDATAISSHPVEGPGKNTDVPSLIAPLSATSTIYCGDCHGSEAQSTNSPRGPHGSTFPHLLIANYSTLDRTGESPSAYALCYRCHDRRVLLGLPGKPRDSSFPLHKTHVVDQNTPCATCHNSHGVSTVAGTPTGNAHLIDFDVTTVQPTKRAPRQYVARGARGGSCTLTCHGKQHDGATY